MIDVLLIIGLAAFGLFALTIMWAIVLAAWEWIDRNYPPDRLSDAAVRRWDSRHPRSRDARRRRRP